MSLINVILDMKIHRKENFPNPVLTLPESKYHPVRGFYEVKQMEEIWKDVDGHEGHYEVSDQGNVKSKRGLEERILKPWKDTGGYFAVGICKDCKKKNKKIHKLVAIAFLNHKPEGQAICVDHINNIKTDNRLINLQLISHRENLSKDKKGGTSKYVGVHWYKASSKWIAIISLNGKNKYLGYFTDELDAHNAYQKALKEINDGNEIIMKKAAK